MNQKLAVSAGQWSEAGIKEANDDSCGVRVPENASLTTKGVAVVIADGVSASEAGREASHACVQGFLEDYYSTPDSWTVKTSGQKILGALNHWLHGQGMQRYGSARGMVTTLSALVVKSTTAHLFHVGDTRIYRLRDDDLECLTRDHRVQVAGDKSYLGRAMGIELHVDIDYQAQAVMTGDMFILTTDGVHDFLTDEALGGLARSTDENLTGVCREIVQAALANDSHDNVTCQILRIDALPDTDKNLVYEQLTQLPFPPPLEPGMTIDGFRVVRELHTSKRTEVFLVVDESTGMQAVLKAPSVNYEDDPTYIDMFLHEEWVGKRLNNPHIMKIHSPTRSRTFLYTLAEYIEGQTLRQWIYDHRQASLSEVRPIIEQIAMGLRAFHRMEMIHQDLKPENIMIDRNDTVKIVDFGSTKIAGIEEITTPIGRLSLLGTENYTAPEYLQGYKGSNRSDIYSLGVITYEMLTGHLPYGEGAARKDFRRLHYTSALKYNQVIPVWIDSTLKKCVNPDPNRRYDTLSEFLHDLSYPNPRFISEWQPLIERHPLAFWRTLAILLALINLVLAYYLLRP
jgi:serine/threonine protein phosphatase PrpC